MKAVVDIGSNTVKFVAGRFSRSALELIDSGSWTTRLGRNLDKNGGLLEAASLTLTRQALEAIGRQLGALNPPPERFFVAATAAARNAKNSHELAQMVQEVLGVPLSVLSGQEEALWSMRGAQMAATLALGSCSDALYVDVGGASTEVGFLDPEPLAHSFDAGAVKCHEGLGLDKLPVSDATWSAAKREIARYFPKKHLAPLLNHAGEWKRPVVAVGGTLLMASRLCPGSVEHETGIEVEADQLIALNEKLRTLDLEGRCALPHIDRSRADILCAGVLCLTHLLETFSLNKIFVTAWGWRYGLLADEQP